MRNLHLWNRENSDQARDQLSMEVSLKILAEAAEGDGILTIEMIRDILGMDDDQSSAA